MKFHKIYVCEEDQHGKPCQKSNVSSATARLAFDLLKAQFDVPKINIQMSKTARINLWHGTEITQVLLLTNFVEIQNFISYRDI